jgi:hypothetical protein
VLEKGLLSTTRYRRGNGIRRGGGKVGPRHPATHPVASHRDFHSIPSAVRYHQPYPQQPPPYTRGPRIPSPARPDLAASGMAMHMTPHAESMDGLYRGPGHDTAMHSEGRPGQPRPEYTPITPPDGIPEMEFWNQPPSGYGDYQYGLSDVTGVYPGGQLFENETF